MPHLNAHEFSYQNSRKRYCVVPDFLFQLHAHPRRHVARHAYWRPRSWPRKRNCAADTRAAELPARHSYAGAFYADHQCSYLLLCAKDTARLACARILGCLLGLDRDDSYLVDHQPRHPGCVGRTQALLALACQLRRDSVK